MLHQKTDQNIFRRTMSETGTITNPENEDTLNNLYGKLWGQE